MSERFALDYTNGAGESIPPETWSGIDPGEVVRYARSRVPEGVNLPKNVSLIELANASELGLSDANRREIQWLLGKQVLAVES